MLDALRACQEEARRKHVGIYEFGDVDSEEEDDGGGFLLLQAVGSIIESLCCLILASRRMQLVSRTARRRTTAVGWAGVWGNAVLRWCAVDLWI